MITAMLLLIRRLKRIRFRNGFTRFDSIRRWIAGPILGDVRMLSRFLILVIGRGAVEGGGGGREAER